MYFRSAQHKQYYYSFLNRAGKTEWCRETDYLACIYILSSLAQDHPMIESCISPGRINFGIISKIGTGATAALIHLSMEVFNPYFWPCRSIQDLIHSYDPYYGRVALNALKIRHLLVS